MIILNIEQIEKDIDEQMRGGMIIIKNKKEKAININGSETGKKQY